MPFLSGTLSVRRYSVQGDVPASLPRTATMAIRRYSYKPIDDERGERETIGWVNPRDVLSNAFTFEDLKDGSVVLLGLRRDRKAYSPVLFKARLRRMIEGAQKEKGGSRKISRQQRLAFEESLAVEMLKETSPTSAFVELAWDMDRGEVYMGATGNAVCDRAAEIFEATFDLRLMPRFPQVIGGTYIAQQGLEEEFEDGAEESPNAAAGDDDSED